LVVMQCSVVTGHQRALHPEDGGSTDLWNVGILLQRYTVSQIRRPRLEASPPWKPQNLYATVCYIHHILHV